MTRLGPQPGERIDRSTTVRFTFDGKPVEAYAGDTIASALYAGGRRIFEGFWNDKQTGLLNRKARDGEFFQPAFRVVAR